MDVLSFRLADWQACTAASVLHPFPGQDRLDPDPVEDPDMAADQPYRADRYSSPAEGLVACTAASVLHPFPGQNRPDPDPVEDPDTGVDPVLPVDVLSFRLADWQACTAASVLHLDPEDLVNCRAPRQEDYRMYTDPVLTIGEDSRSFPEVGSEVDNLGSGRQQADQDHPLPPVLPQLPRVPGRHPERSWKFQELHCSRE